MARDVKVGILISAKDMSSKAFKAAANSSDALFRGVRVGTTAASAGMKSFAIAATGLNQALELAKKGAQVFRETIGQALAKSIEFRGENDAQAKSIKDLQEQVGQLSKRVGDALLPAVNAIALAFKPAIDMALKWLDANMEWLGSGIIEKMGKFASVLVNGVATGVLMVAKAWAGLKMIVNGVQLLIEKFFEGGLKGFSLLNDALASLYGALGFGGLAVAMKNSSDAVRALADEFKRSGEDSKDAIAQNVKDLADMEAKIYDVAGAVQDAIAVAGVEANKQFRTSVLSGNRSLEERNALIELAKQRAKETAEQEEKLRAAAAERMKALHQQAAALISRGEATSLAVSEENHKRRVHLIELEEDARLAAAESARQASDEVMQAGILAAEQQAMTAMSIGAAYGRTFAAVMQGQATVAQGFQAMAGIGLSAIIDMAQKAIMAHAAESAAAAYKSQAGIPIVGPFLGAAAAVAALAVVKSYIGQLPAYATGGEVRGGVPGRDSVLAMLTPGERVLTVQENRESKRGGNGAQMISQDVNVSIGMGMPMQRADIDRYIRDTVLPSTKRLRRLGRS